MIKLTHTFPVLTALIAVTIATPTASCQTRDERAIRAAGEQWQRYIAAKNVDSIVALHTPDAVVMMSHAALTRGTASIRTLYDELVNTPGLILHWTPMKIDVASPTVATEYGTYTESYDRPGGKLSDAGNYVVIWHKIDGRWRIALDAPNTAMPESPAAPPEASEIVSRTGSMLTWTDFTPPGFPAGGKVTVLYGDPFSRGRFVMRLQLPDGYEIPLHWHPTAENLTVLSGGLQLVMSGDLSDGRTYGPGDYVYIPARQAHSAETRGPTVLQIAGQGPFQINLGTPRTGTN
jgi:ketosteroid isomerase-like protein/quercetin dioxygenase-like cupin family protein